MEVRTASDGTQSVRDKGHVEAHREPSREPSAASDKLPAVALRLSVNIPTPEPAIGTEGATKR